MSSVTIPENGLVIKDPADVKTYTMDWGTYNLASGKTILTSVWTITPLSPSTTDAVLTQDNAAIITGGRTTNVRLTAGTLGQLYDIANKITTDETPAQTKERSFRLLVQNR